MSLATPRGRAWERTRRLAFERDGWRCRRCGASGPLECHHVTSIADGGAVFDLANLETLCRRCHVGLHRAPARPDRMPAGWRRLIDELRPERTGDVA